MEMWVNSLSAVIAVLLNASQRSQIGVAMNRSARGGGKVKRSEWSDWSDAMDYKLIHWIMVWPLPIYPGWNRKQLMIYLEMYTMIFGMCTILLYICVVVPWSSRRLETAQWRLSTLHRPSNWTRMTTNLTSSEPRCMKRSLILFIVFA